MERIHLRKGMCTWSERIEMAIATPKFGGLVFGSDKSIDGSGDRHGSFPVGAFCQEIFRPVFFGRDISEKNSRM